MRLAEGAQGAVLVAVEGNAAFQRLLAAHAAPRAVHRWSCGARAARLTRE